MLAPNSKSTINLILIVTPTMILKLIILIAFVVNMDLEPSELPERLHAHCNSSSTGLTELSPKQFKPVRN